MSNPEALSKPKPPVTTQAPLPCLTPQKLPSPSAIHPVSSFICLVGTLLGVMSCSAKDNSQEHAFFLLIEAKLIGAVVQDAFWLPVTGSMTKTSRQWLRSPAVSSPGAGPHLGPWPASGCGRCLYLPAAALPLPAPSAQPATNDWHP